MANDELDEQHDSGREARVIQARQRRDRELARGVTLTLGGTEYRFSTSERSRALIDQAALDAQQRSDGWSKMWLTGDEQVVKLDATQMEQVRQAVADHVEACFANCETLVSQIKQASDPLDVDIGAGWPD